MSAPKPSKSNLNIKWRPTAFTADVGEYNLSVMGELDIGDASPAYAVWHVHRRGLGVGHGKAATLEEAQAAAINAFLAVKAVIDPKEPT